MVNSVEYLDVTNLLEVRCCKCGKLLAKSIAMPTGGSFEIKCKCGEINKISFK